MLDLLLRPFEYESTASFAMRVAIISTYRSFTRSFEAALFGNVLGITSEDVWIVAIVTVVLLSLIFVFYRSLLFWSFDREVAQVHGVSVFSMDTLFALMLAAHCFDATNFRDNADYFCNRYSSVYRSTIERSLRHHDDSLRWHWRCDRLLRYLFELLLRRCQRC